MFCSEDFDLVIELAKSKTEVGIKKEAEGGIEKDGVLRARGVKRRAKRAGSGVTTSLRCSC